VGEDTCRNRPAIRNDEQVVTAEKDRHEIMKIYISGKITGLEYDEAFAMFEAAEVVLAKLGHEPVNPMKKVSEQEGKSWSEYMKEDIPILLECDAIYLLNNWGDSKGARLEKIVAEELGMLVVYDNIYAISHLATHCMKCGGKLSEDDLDLAAKECYRCHNNISSVSGVGIMTHAKV
jgi:hypothetical protein